MKWKGIVNIEEQGGLGIGRLEEKNLALFGKWLWRFFTDNKSLWESIILSRYVIDENTWDYNSALLPSQSLLWNHIVQVGPFFYPYTCFSLGDGTKIRFWKDLWWRNSTLGSGYPRLFHITSLKNVLVAEILFQDAE